MRERREYIVYYYGYNRAERLTRVRPTYQNTQYTNTFIKFRQAKSLSLLYTPSLNPEEDGWWKLEFEREFHKVLIETYGRSCYLIELES